MSAINQLASSLGQNSAIPNQEAAQKIVLLKVINSRMKDDIEQESKRKRVEKVLKKITK